jgi:hypothetical protein
VIFGFEQANKYTVLDQDGNVVALMAEEQMGLGNEIGRQLLRTRRNFSMTVLSADGARRLGLAGWGFEGLVGLVGAPARACCGAASSAPPSSPPPPPCLRPHLPLPSTPGNASPPKPLLAQGPR